jgi:hypothetical protein
MRVNNENYNDGLAHFMKWPYNGSKEKSFLKTWTLLKAWLLNKFFFILKPSMNESQYWILQG